MANISDDMFNVFIAVAFTVLISMTPVVAIAWDGFDYNAGTPVEIEKGNLVRPGEDIQIFDYGSGGYKNVTVESVDSFGSSVDLEVIDEETGETRTLEMDR